MAKTYVEFLLGNKHVKIVETGNKDKPYKWVEEKVKKEGKKK